MLTIWNGIRYVCAWIAVVIANIIFYGLQIAILVGVGALIGFVIYKIVMFFKNRKSGKDEKAKEDEHEVVDNKEVPADAKEAAA